MSRHLRPCDLGVEPIRILTEMPSMDEFCTRDRAKARATCPFNPGDVVRNEEGRPALVVRVFIERIWLHDPSSDLLPVCRVRDQTKAGTWSKSWRYAWPGEIARGFAKAAETEAAGARN